MGKTTMGFDLQWEAAAKQVGGKRLTGLTVKCPVCRRSGMAFSKWVKGTPVKPVFVCHTNGNGHFKSCALGKEDAASVRAGIRLTRPDVLKLVRIGKPVVLFSGGRDSLCLLHYVNGIARSIGREVQALHADTTAGFPEVEKYVQGVCRRWDIPLVTVRPHGDYFDLAKRWGIPGVRSRWCCETLKIAPIRRYLASLQDTVVVFDGIRAAESNVRATYLPVWYHPSFKCLSVSPLFHWSHDKVGRYLQDHDLPKSPAADLNTSAECWCGAYKSRTDFQALLKVHPEIFHKLVEVEEAQNGKFTFLYEGGKQIPLCTLAGCPNGGCSSRK